MNKPNSRPSTAAAPAPRGGKALSTKTKNIIVQNFLQMLNSVKLYHWNTTSYAEHKASDELYSQLNGNIDQFVEVLLGKDASRVRIVAHHIALVDFRNTRTLREKMFEYRVFLTDMSTYLNPKKDSDLLNIRDEMLGNINQFLYLISLSTP